MNAAADRLGEFRFVYFQPVRIPDRFTYSNADCFERVSEAPDHEYRFVELPR